jgi:proteasome activator subunit 4
MDDRLELITQRLIECIKAREWGLGFRTWDAALSTWMSMGYLMKRDIKIKLIFLYYEILCEFPPPHVCYTRACRANCQLCQVWAPRSLTMRALS